LATFWSTTCHLLPTASDEQGPKEGPWNEFQNDALFASDGFRDFLALRRKIKEDGAAAATVE